MRYILKVPHPSLGGEVELFLSSDGYDSTGILTKGRMAYFSKWFEAEPIQKSYLNSHHSGATVLE
jgi:hypothetical protein